MARQKTKFKHITKDNQKVGVTKEVTPEGVKYFIAGTNDRAEGKMMRDRNILDTPCKIDNHKRWCKAAGLTESKSPWQDYAKTSSDL